MRLESKPMSLYGSFISPLKSGFQCDAEARRERVRQVFEAMANANDGEVREIDDGARKPVLVGIPRLTIVEVDGGCLAYHGLDVFVAVLAAGQRQVRRGAEHGGATFDRAFDDCLVELAGVEQHVERAAFG